MLLFMDGFDHYNVSDFAEGELKYGVGNVSGGMINGTGRFSIGQAMDPNSNARSVRRAIGSNLATGVMGCAFKIRASAAENRTIIFSLEDGTSNQIFLMTNTDRTFSVFRGTTSNNLGTSSYQIPSDVWVYVEMKWEIANSISAGGIEVRVNGSTILTVATSSDSQATANAYATHFRIGGNTTLFNNAANTATFDDFYFADLTGSAPAVNNFLGDIRVSTIFPNGNGNANQWLGSDGNSTDNYLLVDDTTDMDADSTYVQESTTSEIDQYTFQDLASNITSVLAVAINTTVRRTDAGPRSIRNITRMSSTDYDNGADIATEASYQVKQTIQEGRPTDSAAWTASDVNSAQFGVKVTA